MGFYLCLLILVETGMLCPGVFWLKTSSLLMAMSFKATFKLNKKQSLTLRLKLKKTSQQNNPLSANRGTSLQHSWHVGSQCPLYCLCFYYRATLIKPSEQIIRSSGFDSTAGWTGFVKLVKPYVFCCWRQSYFSSTAIPNFFTIDSVQHLITGYSSTCPGWAEE